MSAKPSLGDRRVTTEESKRLNALKLLKSLGRYVLISRNLGLDYGPEHGWAEVLANLACLLGGGCDMYTVRELVRRVGLEPIDDRILADPVVNAAHAKETLGRKFELMSAFAVGERIELTSAMREICKIRNIDATDEPSDERQRRLRRKTDAAKRVKDGCRPQALSDARGQPWEYLRMKRSSWYSKGKPMSVTLPDGTILTYQPSELDYFT